MSKRTFFFIPALLLAGCSTITITPEDFGKVTSPPTYQESKPYYLFGLSGEHFINVDEICGEGNTRQMQSQFTFQNALLGIATLGIYTPRTAKVWCIQEASI